MNKNALRSAIVQDQQTFESLEEKWNGLCNTLSNYITVFATFMWYQSWWKFYGGEAKLHLFTLWEGENLIGIAPLMREKVFLHGLSVRRIGFMQNNQSLHNDFIVLPEYRTVFLQKLMHSLFEHSSQWDELYFRNIPCASDNCVSLMEVLHSEGVN